MKFRTTALFSGAIAVALVLTGCSVSANQAGSNPDSNPSADASTGFNSADEMFATGMIPHHQQAVEMADTILGKDGIDDRVVELAQQIKAAQDPEIVTMKGWLSDWGTPYDDSGMGGMDGMDHGEGMMSQSDMDQLDQTNGPETSRLFLEQMIMHHEGAITMAQTEIDGGEYPDAVDLAGAIVQAQTEEIATMQQILDSL